MMSARWIVESWMVAVLLGLVLAGATLLAAEETETDRAEDRAVSGEAQETGAATQAEAGHRTDPAARGKKVFRGAVTVNEHPIVEGNDVDRHGTLVATVSERQIDDLNAQDLSAALRRLPGLVVSRYNQIGAFGGGDGGAVFIRGHGSGRPGAEIVTLVDGVPRFVGVWAHPLLDVLSLDAVDRIEVYRSAQPVLIGNMAFGAVDLISKRRRQAGSGGRLVASGGGNDTLLGRVEYGSRTPRLDYYIEASHRQSDGHRPNADGQVEALSGRLGLPLGEAWNLSLQLYHSNGRVHDPRPVGAPVLPLVERYDTDSRFSLVTLDHQHQGWSGQVKLYHDIVDADWLQWDSSVPEPFTSVTRSSTYGVRLRETIVPWSGGEIVAGLDHDTYGGRFREARRSGDRQVTDLHFRSTSPYLMLSHQFGSQVTVTPSVGARYNSSRFFGNQWGGQAGLRVTFGRQVVYANYAHAFNLPGVYAAVMYGGWGRGDEWQELTAETADHLELGWLAGLGDRVSLDLSLFRDEVSDAIRFLPPPPPPPQFANIGDYEVRGAEVSMQADLTSHVGIFVGVTYSRAEPEDVPNLPETTAVAGLACSAAAWRLNLDLEYLDERYVLNPRYAAVQTKVDSYLVVNTRAAIPLRWLGLASELFLVGENLNDEEYEHRIGYPMPGRTWTLGLDVSF